MANRVEKVLTERVLRDEISYGDFEKNMKDQRLFKLDDGGRKNNNRYTTDKVKTRSRVVRWLWYKHRTANGYFIGYRETYTSDGKTVKDQFTAMRTKNRLSALQKKRFEELLANPNNVRVPHYKDSRVVLPPRPSKPKVDPTVRAKKQRIRLLNAAVKRKVLSTSHEVAFFRKEEDARKLEEVVRALGSSTWSNGRKIGRDPSLDQKRPVLYACVI